MKLKIIGVLTVLLSCGLAASPNKNCDGLRKRAIAEREINAQPVEMELELAAEAESLLPLHRFINYF